MMCFPALELGTSAYENAPLKYPAAIFARPIHWPGSYSWSGAESASPEGAHAGQGRPTPAGGRPADESGKSRHVGCLSEPRSSRGDSSRPC